MFAFIGLMVGVFFAALSPAAQESLALALAIAIPAAIALGCVCYCATVEERHRKRCSTGGRNYVE